MKYLELVKLILSLVPVLISVIKAVEEAIPGSGNGEQKLALVRSMMESAYKAANDVVGSFENIWPVLSQTVTALVSAFNATGVFRKNAG